MKTVFKLIITNRPYHGFEHHFDGQAKREEFVVFIWGFDIK